MATVRCQTTMDEETLERVMATLSEISSLEDLITGSHGPLLGLAFTRSIDLEDGTMKHLATRHSDHYVYAFRTDAVGNLLEISILDRMPQD